MNRLLASLAATALLVAGCALGSTPSPAVPSTAGSPTAGSSAIPSADSSADAKPTLPASAIPSERPTASDSTPGDPSRSPSSSTAPAWTPTSTASPAGTPTPSRSPAPTATPIRTPAPSASAGPSSYVTAGSRSSDRVALTFDFGGRVGDALEIVRYLAAQKVHATIFSTGNQANLAATDATVRQVYEVVCGTSNGLTLGNHSMTHADFATLEPAGMTWELATAQAALARVCPAESPLPFFRPPSGSLGGWRTAKFFEILDTVGAAGYSRTVAWDVDTLDWGAPGTTYYRTAAQIVSTVEARATGGSIVLMHLGGYETYAAVQVLVPWLRSHGHQLVDLHEMLGI